MKIVRVTKRIKTLVFPCGSENASEIYQALRYSVHVELIGASSVEDYGRFRFEHYVGGLPNIREKVFETTFAELIAKLQVGIVFATHDSVLSYLAPRAIDMGFFLVNGDPKTAVIARSKKRTYALFSDCSWAPSVFDSLENVTTWPIVIKPDAGQGGQDVTAVRNRSEAARIARKIIEPIFVEYLPGDEITIDCFTDRKRELVWVGPRTRERVRAGISMRSTFLEATPIIRQIASTINQRLKLRGPWFFQLKASHDNQWKLLEVSCRIAGAMAAQRARGINLPLMAVHDYLERDLLVLPIHQVNLIERNIATRAELAFKYDTVFIDLDDTLVSNGIANPIVLAFLYQSVREGKKIKLITRHALDPRKTLKNARISLELFDEIIHLGTEGTKADYLTETSIFVDNYFPERLAVSQQKGIPVFDVDALEFFVK